jgi:hypothetical protein
MRAVSWKPGGSGNPPAITRVSVSISGTVEAGSRVPISGGWLAATAGDRLGRDEVDVGKPPAA